jgi:hypothetical protein
MRRDRISPRIKFGHVTQVRLSRGEKRCRANLLDFSAGNCAVHITDKAFESWNVEDLTGPITVTMHGEMKNARVLRLNRVRTGIQQAWILGMDFR